MTARTVSSIAESGGPHEDADAPGPTAESCASRRTAMGFRAGLEKLFGDAGVEQVRSLLSAEADGAFFGAATVGQPWIPERHLVAFMRSVLDGPCGRNRLKFREWNQVQIMNGFGRVKAAMLRIVTPQMLARRAAELWVEEHTRGAMSSVMLDARSAEVTLVDHEYAENPLARAVLTESLRTLIAASAHTRDVRGSFDADLETKLVMTFVWA